MKIHVSETTKELLDVHGGFIMERRGTIEIKVYFNTTKKFLIIFYMCYKKGKGDMETFWLLGHEKLKAENLTPLDVDEIYQAMTSEPEFFQII